MAPEWDPDRLVPFMVNAMVITFVGPVVEELTFRGLGFTLLRRYGPGLAIATTGVLFALSHGLIAVLPIAASFGFGLAYLRSRTDSVYPGMLLHVPSMRSASWRSWDREPDHLTAQHSRDFGVPPEVHGNVSPPC